MYRSIRTLIALQQEQVAFYEEIMDILKESYPVTWSIDDTSDGNVAARFALNDRSTLPSDDGWIIDGQSYPEVYITIWARNDWNAGLDSVTIGTELFMPDFVMPLSYSESRSVTVYNMWLDFPDNIGHGDHAFNSKEKGRGQIVLYGNAKGGLTIGSRDRDAGKVAKNIAEYMEFLTDEIAKFWTKVENTG